MAPMHVMPSRAVSTKARPRTRPRSTSGVVRTPAGLELEASRRRRFGAAFVSPVAATTTRKSGAPATAATTSSRPASRAASEGATAVSRRAPAASASGASSSATLSPSLKSPSTNGRVTEACSWARRASVAAPPAAAAPTRSAPDADGTFTKSAREGSALRALRVTSAAVIGARFMAPPKLEVREASPASRTAGPALALAREISRAANRAMPLPLCGH
mmetsp:Transcript_26613/g.79811  ORF Transcript_26613/g.79811 Transcript_26613/m.79811 type:complete len:218 (-) Transcript_26613:63-716(-)